jgi:hypothetical protein
MGEWWRGLHDPATTFRFPAAERCGRLTDSREVEEAEH